MLRRSRQRGFTLIEIMIVVMIIGLSAGMATLAFAPNDTTELEKTVDKFMLQAEFVSEQAVLTGDVIGLFVAPRSARDGDTWCYQWRRFRNSAWQPVSDFLTDQCLRSALELELVVEGESYEYDERETTPKPVLMFYPSGEATRLEMALFLRFDSEKVERIEVDMMGSVRWQSRAQELAEQERQR